MVTYSAPGKLMLLGDHAVVYGEPCIASAVNRRIFVTVRRSSEDSIHIPANTDSRFIQATISYFHKRTGQSGTYDISTRAEFTDQFGFGSSSAVTVALLACLYDLWGCQISPSDLFNQAYEIHGGVQGNGSGFDIACAVHGGTIWYRRGDELPEQLSSNITNYLIICYSGVKAKTGPLVSEVQRKYAQEEGVRKRIKTMGTLVNRAKTALLDTRMDTFGIVCTTYQEHLDALGVSTPKLNALIHAAVKAGAWGAKLSGAGGGDCMFAVISPQKKEEVVSALVSAGGEVIAIQLHADGFKKHF